MSRMSLQYGIQIKRSSTEKEQQSVFIIVNELYGDRRNLKLIVHILAEIVQNFRFRNKGLFLVL